MTNDRIRDPYHVIFASLILRFKSLVFSSTVISRGPLMLCIIAKRRRCEAPERNGDSMPLMWRLQGELPLRCIAELVHRLTTQLVLSVMKRSLLKELL